MLLRDAIEAMLETYSNPKTREAYYYPLRRFRDWAGPTREVAGITPIDLARYNANLEQAGYALATQRKNAIAVRRLFNWLVEMEVIARSPATKTLKKPNYVKYVEEDKAMDDAALERLLMYAAFHPRLDALVRYLADTGGRIGGAAGLTVDAINFDRREAIVTEKGQPPRRVTWGPSTNRAMQVWYLRRGKDGLFFFSARGKPIKNDNLGQYFRRACMAAGIGSWGPHSLRHRKGHQLAAAGVPPSVAADAMGHSNVLTTLQHYYPRGWEEARAALQGLTLGTEEAPKITRRKAR